MDNIINTTYRKILEETKSILEKYTLETDIENNRITIKQDNLPYIKAEIVNYITSLNDTNYNPSLMIATKEIDNNEHHKLKFCSTIDNETRLYVEYPNTLIENTVKQFDVDTYNQCSIYEMLSCNHYTELENLFNAIVKHKLSIFDKYQPFELLFHQPVAKNSELEYDKLSSKEQKAYQRGYVVAQVQELIHKPLSELIKSYNIEFINSVITGVELAYER